MAERQLWRQTKADDAERRKLGHKLKALVGAAKVLETDSEETKKRKRAGWKGTSWGQAVVAAGASLPFGEELPGKVYLPAPELMAPNARMPETAMEMRVAAERAVKAAEKQCYVDVSVDWSEHIGPGDYLMLRDQVSGGRAVLHQDFAWGLGLSHRCSWFFSTGLVVLLSWSPVAPLEYSILLSSVSPA